VPDYQAVTLGVLGLRFLQHAQACQVFFVVFCPHLLVSGAVVGGYDEAVDCLVAVATCLDGAVLKIPVEGLEFVDVGVEVFDCF